MGVAENSPLFEEATEKEGYFSVSIRWSTTDNSLKTHSKEKPSAGGFATVWVRSSW